MATTPTKAAGVAARRRSERCGVAAAELWAVVMAAAVGTGATAATAVVVAAAVAVVVAAEVEGAAAEARIVTAATAWVSSAI